MSEPLTGKVAIVTGAGRMRGLGRAIAVALAEHGADVAVTARARAPESFPEPEKEAGWKGAESVAEEVRALGRRAIALEVDVTSGAEVEAMVQRTMSELGRADVLVNNAGIALVSGAKSLWEMEDEGVAARDRRQSERRLPLLQGRRAGADRAGRGRAHHQHIVTGGSEGAAAVRRLHAGEVRGERADADAGAGAGQVRGDCQLRVPGIVRHGHDGRDVSADRGANGSDV